MDTQTLPQQTPTNIWWKTKRYDFLCLLLSQVLIIPAAIIITVMKALTIIPVLTDGEISGIGRLVFFMIPGMVVLFIALIILGKIFKVPRLAVLAIFCLILIRILVTTIFHLPSLHNLDVMIITASLSIMAILHTLGRWRDQTKISEPVLVMLCICLQTVGGFIFYYLNPEMFEAALFGFAWI
jgi:hypothetical protein